MKGGRRRNRKGTSVYQHAATKKKRGKKGKKQRRSDAAEILPTERETKAILKEADGRLVKR